MALIADEGDLNHDQKTKCDQQQMCVILLYRDTTASYLSNQSCSIVANIVGLL